MGMSGERAQLTTKLKDRSDIRLQGVGCGRQGRGRVLGWGPGSAAAERPVVG